MAYTKYSLTPADNNAAPPNGAPEGMLPSAVNDTMRDMMSQIRDVGDGIRGGTYTMTAPVITGGSVNGAAIGGTTRAAGSFTTITGTNDASISGLTVGKGLASIATNTALGASALAATTTGNFNTALGYRAGFNDTTGYYNTLLGADVGNSLTTGFQNTAVGANNFGSGGATNTTGNSNSAFGYASMYSLTSGSSNTAFGQSSLYSNTTGANNTAVGLQALQANTTASANTAVGFQSGYSNTTGAQNIFLGAYAGYSNTTASANTFIGGDSTGYYNTTGASNTAVGHQSFTDNTTGANNTALGKDALQKNTTASYMTAVGSQAGFTHTGGEWFSSFVGFQAGYASTGASNTFFGAGAGAAITTGAKNSIIGRYNGNQGGLDIRTASNYLVLSDGDGNPLISTSQGRSVALEGAVPQTGEGITFPATQSASSNANTLDDYEEGTWTPVIDSDTVGSGRVTTINSANYTKIGNTVFVQCYISLATLGTGGANALVLTGFPFVAIGSSYYSSLSVSYALNFNANLSSIGCYVAVNSTKAYFNGASVPSVSPLDNLGFSTYAKAGMQIILSGCYQTT